MNEKRELNGAEISFHEEEHQIQKILQQKKKKKEIEY